MGALLRSRIPAAKTNTFSNLTLSPFGGADSSRLEERGLPRCSLLRSGCPPSPRLRRDALALFCGADSSRLEERDLPRCSPLRRNVRKRVKGIEPSCSSASRGKGGFSRGKWVTI